MMVVYVGRRDRPCFGGPAGDWLRNHDQGIQLRQHADPLRRDRGLHGRDHARALGGGARTEEHRAAARCRRIRSRAARPWYGRCFRRVCHRRLAQATALFRSSWRLPRVPAASPPHLLPRRRLRRHGRVRPPRASARVATCRRNPSRPRLRPSQSAICCFPRRRERSASARRRGPASRCRRICCRRIFAQSAGRAAAARAGRSATAIVRGCLAETGAIAARRDAAAASRGRTPPAFDEPNGARAA